MDRKSWKDCYPDKDPSTWTPELMAMLDGLLQFSPYKRLTIEDAMRHPWLADLHEEDEEDDEAEVEPIDWSFDQMAMTKGVLQRAIYRECASFHPEILERDAAFLARDACR